MKTFRKTTSLLASLTLGLVLASPAADASPRERIEKERPVQAGTAQRHVDRERGDGSKRVTVTGTTADGRNWERRTETVKTADGYTRTHAGTTADGKTFNRTATLVHDREAGTWSRDVSGTTPAGKPFDTHVEGQRTEQGYTSTATHTAPDGTVVTRNVVATRGEDGALDKEVTRTVTPPQNGAAASE
jgi:hypothetical protein